MAVESLPGGEAAPLRVLVTGAYGLIGNLVVARLLQQPRRFDVYGSARRRRLSERAEGSDTVAIPGPRFRPADLTNLRATLRAVRGMEVVIHLAADPDSRSPWKSILRNNIIATHNLFEASRREGVRRVVLASTNQVVFGYRTSEPAAAAVRGSAAGTQIRHDMPTKPLSDYAASKVYCEALAHMYAFAHDMSCICLRIGWVTARDDVRNPALWCSRRDVVQIIERAITAPSDLRFDVFFAHSDNRENLVDIDHARDVLGYRPEDGAKGAPV